MQPVQVKFTHLDIDCVHPDAGRYSTQDHLHVSEPGVKRFLKTTFCGTKLPPIMKSRTGHILIELVSDDLTERAGFRLVWDYMGKGQEIKMILHTVGVSIICFTISLLFIWVKWVTLNHINVQLTWP